MPIIISENGKNARKLNPSFFRNEDYLQNYIHNNPESLPFYELKDDIRVFVAAREFPTLCGSIDALGFDGDGIYESC